jgi:hypothetical protein
VIWTLCAQPIAWHRGLPASLAFATFRRDPKALLAPEPLGAFAVDRPAVLQQTLVSLAISPSRPLARERPQRRSQRRVIFDYSHDVALGRAVLPRQPARPTLREPEPLLESQDGTTSPGRAQKFPADNSLSP